MKRTLLQYISVVMVLAMLSGRSAQAPQPVQAQTTINPSSWQAGSVGLRAVPDNDLRTAGLGFIVTASGWPSLSMQGGVQPFWDVMLGPVGVPMGKIKTLASSTANLSAQSTSWAKNKMTFTPSSGGAVNLWASRLSPAVLAETTDSALRLFAGNVIKYEFSGDQIVERQVPVRPKYLSYSTGGTRKYATLGTGNTSLTALDQGWLLLWMGNNTHVMETRRILDYGAPFLSDAYMADVPILLVFQNQPTAIKLSSEGGVEVTFSGAAGRIAILPLYGRDHLPASQTEGWYNNLPTGVQQKIQFWAPRLAYFPADVAETYSYSGGNATITETITYETVRAAGGTKFAPLPPILSLARPLLNPVFSHAVQGSGYASQFGPIEGIDNRDSYSWTVTDVSHYIDPQRLIPQSGGTVPADLQAELENQVTRLVGAGHMDPWVYADQVPNVDYRGDIYWANPADALYALSEVADALPDGATKNSLISYMSSERNNFKPEYVYNLDFGLGAPRGPAGLPTVGDNMDAELDDWWYQNDNVFLTDVPLYSFYGLARFYQTVGGTPPPDAYSEAVNALNRDMSEQDWASLGWFQGYQDRREAVVNTNRHFAGMVGFVRMADRVGDSAASNLGRALVAKAMVARLGQLQYTHYLYQSGIVQLSSNPKWQLEGLEELNIWLGVIYNYDWRGSYDDARQVIRLNQFSFDLFDHSGYEDVPEDFDRGTTSAHLIGYRDMVPELGRVFADFALEEASVTLDKYKTITPHWYATYGEATLGMEHGMNHPMDSFQLFMAETYLNQPTPDKLARYADIAWLERGDLFYMQKLAEAVLAYRGAVWENKASLSVTPGDQEIFLTWTFQGVIEEPFTWRVDYRNSNDPDYTSISGLAPETRSYRITGLENYQTYYVRVAAVGNTSGQELVTTSPVFTLATDLFVHLPVIRR